MTPISAVAFDIDGTLYPNWRMYLASVPFALGRIRLLRAYGRARRQIRVTRPIVDLRTETAELTAHALGVTLEAATHRIETEIYQQWELSLSRVPLFRGAVELLQWLRASEIKTAAMSDFPVVSKLALLGISDYWDVAFSSEDVGYLKPNPEPFERLSVELAVPVGEILYVGNSYHYDIEGARAVGLQTAHIARRPVRASNADVTVRTYQELKHWIEPRIAHG